jgi:hypothetical protein
MNACMYPPPHMTVFSREFSGEYCAGESTVQFSQYSTVTSYLAIIKVHALLGGSHELIAAYLQ